MKISIVFTGFKQNVMCSVGFCVNLRVFICFLQKQPSIHSVS